ncbi:biotin carboxylase N-terminal domain-containing protein [Gordonia sp. PS3]|uniref:biotin carboxylase n=1 Tax=Gordonia sihwensis NBRC 108236 TaxID=1223544 RepID=L7LE84_9ACTN|nr:MULTISPECIES: acetyl/propionyl/methylcrotonyl-CoA carboxylase subunit alpha [Gordonia]AUH69842.1 acetyl/propionyl/methylcrotonyl-CoA carboxylase subunit alpha [Gordonia sp. YC-JH1]KJR05958.1 acetyl-COA carboxylase [Gordonia sihwensis]KXT56513.1 acetyl-COA carboxylase [Gordonia sp. QH-12]MBY4571586.1 acetyl/propionyl-CoA carboxylase subunit alpha [Gordonia sihwensis]WFN93561.1 acetyl/propionyl/methylcrotonyl-CoA carboxylase subunit alpha [Gordonia sihwensis]
MHVNTTTDTRSIRKVLVANRGEIACRVIATLHDMGIKSVAVYSDADADAPHVKAADEAVRLGPAPATQSYLRIDAVIEAARLTGADAVHPGYGFLSENQQFAEALAEAGIIFIGPPASAIATMGDKITARDAVTKRSVPVVPGISRPGLTDQELIDAAGGVGFPVLIKPSAGGGGKGMHRVEDPSGLPEALATARREAASAFGDDTLFLEHFVLTPRHIEVQILADEHGNVIHLGERECSLQRRHQKVIEEAPSALLDEATRQRIGEAACDAARSVGYTGAGTVEFIVSATAPEDFFFMEMNTRLQVEHPVTEMVTGVDLVEQQVRIARGEKLALTQDDIVMTGHAVEARVYAEDPAQGFLPTGGEVTRLSWPRAASMEPARLATGAQRPGVRVDSGIEEGSVIGSDYDPMLAKVIAYGTDRAEALDRLDEALSETRLLGVVTNIGFCRYALAQRDVRDGVLDTELLDRIAADYAAPMPDPHALVAGALGALDLGDPDDLWSSAIGFRIGAPSPVLARLAESGHVYTVSAQIDQNRTPRPGTLDAHVTISFEDLDREPWQAPVRLRQVPGDAFDLIVDGRSHRWEVAVDARGGRRWVSGRPGTWILHTVRALSEHDEGDAAGHIVSPMPGTVVAVPGVDGEQVAAGDPLVVVEAMKMEHTLRAPIDGTASIKVRVGDKVDAQQLLAHVQVDD